MSYYWLPFRDENWHLDTISRMARADSILPFDDCSPAGRTRTGANRRNANWKDITLNDHLFVVGHGHKFSTNMISWKLNDAEHVTWTASELADRLAYNLTHAKNYNLTIHVLACFSGNNITFFSKSFGKKLAKKLRSRGFSGNLVCYKGGVGMLKARGHQTGSSRITAAPHFIFGSGADVKGKSTDNSTIKLKI
ncbi:hypothetical protein [Photobacterium marinum]|uniref:hypothetical protein n=1 Tax=Photobacterium marinum TaxID=1056511 RepID=UPI00055B1A8C|nr:hypothetical protein [Photobacterium marinum]